MSEQVCKSVQGWQFSEQDVQANHIFQSILKQTRKQAPQQIYMSHSLIHLKWIKGTSLYKLMQTIPKSTMHHVHIDCCEDQEFYREHIITDPNVYLTKDHMQLRFGTKQQAQKQQWKSLTQLRDELKSQDALVQTVSNITMLNKQQIDKYAGKQSTCWDLFQKKITNFFSIYFVQHIFKKYIKHILLKFIKNGYDRIEFRALLGRLKGYDKDGSLVGQHDEDHFVSSIDEVYQQVKQQYPDLTIGFIFFGLKVLPAEENQKIFTKVCQLNWDKTIGFDFVQQEDGFADLNQYDWIIDKVLKKYPHCDYKKVYHAGETNNHLTDNIQIAVKAGSVRIGHGFNILQRIQFLPQCKHICFQKNPLSNLVLGYKSDSRTASAPVLLGLGYAVTINPDDPGKFGVDDATVDYFISVLSFNWTLRHLKLLAYHSINHAICSSQVRASLLKKFNQRWNKWVIDLLKSHQPICNK